MFKKLFYFILFSNLYAASSIGGRFILFIFFIGLGFSGYKFITIRSGNYDVDYFTKIIGWIMLGFGAYGIIELINRYIIK